MQRSRDGRRSFQMFQSRRRNYAGNGAFGHTFDVRRHGITRGWRTGGSMTVVRTRVLFALVQTVTAVLDGEVVVLQSPK